MAQAAAYQPENLFIHGPLRPKGEGDDWIRNANSVASWERMIMDAANSDHAQQLAARHKKYQAVKDAVNPLKIAQKISHKMKLANAMQIIKQMSCHEKAAIAVGIVAFGIILNDLRGIDATADNAVKIITKERAPEMFPRIEDPVTSRLNAQAIIPTPSASVLEGLKANSPQSKFTLTPKPTAEDVYAAAKKEWGQNGTAEWTAVKRATPADTIKEIARRIAQHSSPRGNKNNFFSKFREAKSIQTIRNILATNIPS